MSRTQHGDACGDRIQDLSIRSLTLYHYATTHSTAESNVYVAPFIPGVRIQKADLMYIFVSAIKVQCCWRRYTAKKLMERRKKAAHAIRK